MKTPVNYESSERLQLLLEYWSSSLLGIASARAPATSLPRHSLILVHEGVWVADGLHRESSLWLLLRHFLNHCRSCQPCRSICALVVKLGNLTTIDRGCASAGGCLPSALGARSIWSHVSSNRFRFSLRNFSRNSAIVGKSFSAPPGTLYILTLFRLERPSTSVSFSSILVCYFNKLVCTSSEFWILSSAVMTWPSTSSSLTLVF